MTLNRHRITKEDFERIYGKLEKLCPSIEDTKYPVHFPHEKDLKKYYKCYMGRAYLMNCPDDTEWSPFLDNCVEKRKIHMRASDCPAVDDPKNPVHIPHPFECNLFFKCANGSPVLMECPVDLHWSIKTNRCERPEDAGCSIN